MSKYILILAFVFLSHASSSWGQEATYEVDPHSQNSKISFVSGTIFYDVVGVFKDYSGQIVLNQQDMSQSKVKIRLNPGSVDTQNDTRDQHLKSEDFFDVKNFPEADFQSVKVSQVDQNTYSMSGRLTLHGVRQMTEWKVAPTKKYTDPQGKERVVFRAETSVDRKVFGIFWNADQSFNPLNEKKPDGFWSKLKNDALKNMGNQFIRTDEVKIEVQLEAVRS